MDGKIILSLLLPVALLACENQNDQSPETLDVKLGELRKVDNSEQLEAYIKKGLHIPSSSTVVDFARENTTVATAEATINTAQLSTPADSAASPGRYSGTNTQEQNVDESDIIKYDGEFLYIATRPEYIYPIALDSTSTTQPIIEDTSGIRVMQRTGTAQMTELAWPKLEQTNAIDQLFLHQDSLVSLGHGYGEYSIMPVLYDSWYWGQPETVLNFFDVSTPADISPTHKIQIDGHLETSRRIDDTLYLVTRYTPYLPQLMGNPLDTMSTEAESIIEQANIDDLLPKISINDQTQNLLNPTDCYLPKDTDNTVGYANIIVITAINISNPDAFTSMCFNAMSHGIYTSENAMYISASTLGEETVIHKFNLQDGKARYSASGFIKGNLGWQNPSFRMSEYNDHLRIISTKRSEPNDLIHQLYVLKDNAAGKMELISTLPNETRPERIGKPGENITAVRYYGSRAYVVTFERIDPLYVINLEDHSKPFIQGSLEIPGFSSYLHPVNDNLLLGVGWDSGVKLSLFDVSDLSKPEQINSFVWEGAYSPLQSDYKALAFIELSPQHYRFSFPIHQNYWFNDIVPSYNGLHLFDLEIDASATTLSQAGILSADALNYSYRDRSIIQNDEVFYIHGNRVWSAPWSLEFINDE